MPQLWSSLSRSAQFTRPAAESCEDFAKRYGNWRRLNHEIERPDKRVRPRSTRIVLERRFERRGGTRLHSASEHMREMPLLPPTASGGAGSLDGSGKAAEAGRIRCGELRGGIGFRNS